MRAIFFKLYILAACFAFFASPFSAWAQDSQMPSSPQLQEFVRSHQEIADRMHRRQSSMQSFMREHPQIAQRFHQREEDQRHLVRQDPDD